MPIKKILGFTAVATILFTTLFSCDKDPVGPSVDALVGKWILKSAHSVYSIDMGGMKMTQDTTVTYTDESNYMDLRADKTYTLKAELAEMGSEEELFKKRVTFTSSTSADVGTWALSGDNLVLTSTTADTTITMPIKLSGNNLTGTMKMNESMEGMSLKATITLNFKK